MSTSRFAVTALAALGMSTLAWPVISFTTSPEGFDLSFPQSTWIGEPFGNYFHGHSWGTLQTSSGAPAYLISNSLWPSNLPGNTHLLIQSDDSGLGGSWQGNFRPGDTLFFYDRPVFPDAIVPLNLANDATIFWGETPTNGDIKIAPTFRSARLGAYVQTAALGQFTAQIRALINDGWTSWHSATGNSTNAADGSALFLGAASTSTNLISVQIRARSVNSAVWGYYAISRPSYSFTPVPEPATMTALALGCAFLRRRRKACKSRNA